MPRVRRRVRQRIELATDTIDLIHKGPRCTCPATVREWRARWREVRGAVLSHWRKPGLAPSGYAPWVVARFERRRGESPEGAMVRLGLWSMATATAAAPRRREFEARCREADRDPYFQQSRARQRAHELAIVEKYGPDPGFSCIGVPGHVQPDGTVMPYPKLEPEPNPTPSRPRLRAIRGGASNPRRSA